jgi:voltage-gated potassium channel Kch
MLLVLILVPIALSPDKDSSGIITAVIAGGAATLAMAASEAKRWAIRISWFAWVVVILAFVIPGDQAVVSGVASLILGFLLIATPFVIVRRIAQHEIITGTTMWGAIAAYLALGIAFSFIFATIHTLDPDAFKAVIDGGLGEFNYFSFVTMTTLGYGDITPVTDLARAVVVFQTVMGQIFLVVVVARVVSLLGTGRTMRQAQED